MASTITPRIVATFRHTQHTNTGDQHPYGICLSAGYDAAELYSCSCFLQRKKLQSVAENRRIGACGFLFISLLLESTVWISKQLFSWLFVFSLSLCISSFTNTDPLCYPALFADHIAAPVKLAVATFAPRLLQDVVTPPTAQALTVVHSGTGLVTDPTLRARRV